MGMRRHHYTREDFGSRRYAHIIVLSECQGYLVVDYGRSAKRIATEYQQMTEMAKCANVTILVRAVCTCRSLDHSRLRVL